MQAKNNVFQQIQNKIFWLYQYKLKVPEVWQGLLSILQFRWLLYMGSKPMNISQKSALIISPHQDDEVLGCGGLISLKQSQNIPVKIVFITDGAASHSWHSDFKSGEIVPVRKNEAITALSILGVDVSQIHFLDKPDSKLTYLSDNEREKTIRELKEIIESFQPEEVYITHRHDRTKEHEAAYKLTVEAIERSPIKVDLFQYPIWMLWNAFIWDDLKSEDLAGAYRLAIHSVLQKKQQAIAAYHSQYTAIDQYYDPVLKPSFLRRFNIPYEIFFQTDM